MPIFKVNNAPAGSVLNLIKFDSPDEEIISFSNKIVYHYGATTDFTINGQAESIRISAENMV